MTAEPSVFFRPSESRGNSDLGWLKSYHTFAFGAYYTDVVREQKWGTLRVINEDRVSPSKGFPPHSHANFEIFSYVVDGSIKHQDSMGNVENLERGSVQMTSAGTGIKHSEYNGGSGSEGLHFLQCWALPDFKGLPPKYYTRYYSDEEKTGKLLAIVAPIGAEGVTEDREGSGPTPIHSPLTLYASILPSSTSVSHKFSDTPKKGLLHLIMRAGYRSPKEAAGDGPKLTVTAAGTSTVLQEGDSIYLDGMKGQEVKIESTGMGNAEFVFFDLEDK